MSDMLNVGLGLMFAMIGLGAFFFLIELGQALIAKYSRKEEKSRE